MHQRSGQMPILLLYNSLFILHHSHINKSDGNVNEEPVKFGNVKYIKRKSLQSNNCKVSFI